MRSNRNVNRGTHSIGLFTEFKKLITSKLFNGFIAFLCLIAYLFNNDPRIQYPAIVILLVCFFVLRKVVWEIIKRIISWRLILGIVIGIIIGIACYPYISEAYKLGVSLFIPKVEVIETKPINNGTLEPLYDSVKIRFSERVLPQYRKYIEVEINPYIKTDRIWILEDNQNPSEGSQQLNIEPAKFFKDAQNPQFEPNTKYHFQIKGPLIKNPFTIEFQTPK